MIYYILYFFLYTIDIFYFKNHILQVIIAASFMSRFISIPFNIFHSNAI